LEYGREKAASARALEEAPEGGREERATIRKKGSQASGRGKHRRADEGERKVAKQKERGKKSFVNTESCAFDPKRGRPL